jgi:hypothetical protein
MLFRTLIISKGPRPATHPGHRWHVVRKLFDSKGCDC